MKKKPLSSPAAPQQESNGASLSSPKDVPDGWRPEWTRKSDRKKRGKGAQRLETVSDAATVVARARVELPGADELRRLAMGFLLEVAQDVAAQEASRVGAAKALLEETRPNPREVLLKLLEGDEERLEAWLVTELEACRKRRGSVLTRCGLCERHDCDGDHTVPADR